jgi:hypothetical protein
LNNNLVKNLTLTERLRDYKYMLRPKKVASDMLASNASVVGRNVMLPHQILEQSSDRKNHIQELNLCLN